MNTLERGMKHACPACEIKYYDLGKDLIACPKCGAKPLPPKLRRTTQPVKKTGRTIFGRYP